MSARRRRISRSSAMGAVVAAAISFVSPSATAAPPPVTLSPASGPTGTVFTLSTGCPTAPLVQDVEVGTNTTGTVSLVEGPTGTWSAEMTAGTRDILFAVTCRGAGMSAVQFDTEAPQLFAGPWVPGFGLTEPATQVVGTDCPAGTTPHVVIQVLDAITTADPPIDERGDWAVDLPAASRQAGADVTASCGSVTYEPLHVRPPVLSLTASPTTGVPGDVITVTLTGCTAGRGAFIGYQYLDIDVIATFALDVRETDPGVWTAPFRLPDDDRELFGGCGSIYAPTWGATTLSIDVESYVIHLDGDSMPILGNVPRLSSARGTDCPVGGVAEVTFVADGGVTTVVEVTPDANGTWSAPAPENEKGDGFTVSATCGGVTYPAVAWMGGADLSGPPTTTTSTPGSGAPNEPPGATPVPGSAAFAG